MSDWIPLKSLERDELEVSLLRSADQDQPAPEAVRRVAAALGVSAAWGALAASEAAAATKVAAAGGGMSAAGKVLVVAALAGGLMGGGLVLRHFATSVEPAPTREPTRPVPETAPAQLPAPSASPESNEPVADVTPSPRTAPALRVSPPRTEAPPTSSIAEAAGPVVAPSTAPGASALPAPQPRPSSNSAQPTSGSPSIVDEVAELDRVRALLATRQPRAALSLLSTHESRFPRGALALEAQLLRVEAELASGNRAAAERHARELIASAPGTRHARKAAALVGIEAR